MALSMIRKELRDAMLALRTLRKAGFARNGAFTSGYRRRIRALRRMREGMMMASNS